jgi:hypothetical protein
MLSAGEHIAHKKREQYIMVNIVNMNTGINAYVIHYSKLCISALIHPRVVTTKRLREVGTLWAQLLNAELPVKIRGHPALILAMIC